MAEHSAPNTDERPKGFIERGLHWPLMLLGMFLVSASFVIVTAVLGAGSGSHMVEPDYYARAVDWDSERERLEAAERLGWDVRVSASGVLNPVGTRLVSVLIFDSEGDPIESAIVQAICFAHTQAHDRTETEIPHVGAGQYQTRIQGMHTGGLWEFRVSIDAQGEQALVIESLELGG